MPGGVLIAMAAGLAIVAAEPASRQAAVPLVSVRYHGNAAGVPILDDLAAIRAVGFEAIAWPATATRHTADLRRLADIVGLAVVLAPAPVHLTPAGARTPGSHVDVQVPGRAARAITPLVWRAIAHGARTVAFDPAIRAGTGLTTPAGEPAEWVRPAVTIARQLSANRTLVSLMKPGPAVTVVTPAPAGLDVRLLDGGRAWIVIATNISPVAVKSTVTFARGVPYGVWASWLDGSGMSMLGLPSGPQWTVTLDAYGTRVYFIDKNAYFSTSSTVTTFTGPRFAARMGFSMLARSPTTTTANLSGWMYCAAARCASAAVTA